MDNRVEKYLLYADDDSDDQEIMRDMIAAIDPNLGFVTVDNGIKVLEYLHDLPADAVYPCFIILDMNMPQFNGIQTLQKLKSDKDLKDIPVVVFSTSSQRIDIDRSMQSGAHNFITKPIHFAELSRVTAQFSHYCHDLPVQIRSAKQ